MIIVVKISAAFPVSVNPAFAALAATSRTSKASAASILADKISYNPLERVLVASPYLIANLLNSVLYLGINFIEVSSNIVEILANSNSYFAISWTEDFRNLITP